MVSSAQETSTHIAKPNDTWCKLSRRTGTPVDKLKEINGATPDLITIGQPIKIKGPAHIDYTVLPGDTLWSISKRTGIPVAILKKINGLTSDTLSVGQILKIQQQAETQQEKPNSPTTSKQSVKTSATDRPKYTQQEIQTKIRAEAKNAEVDECLALALAEQESKFDSEAISKTGAIGVFQLKEETGKWLGVKDCYNADENIAGGIKYLKWCIDNTSTEEEALVAYNRGLGGLKAAKAAGEEIDSITDKSTTKDGTTVGFAKAVSLKKANYKAN